MNTKGGIQSTRCFIHFLVSASMVVFSQTPENHLNCETVCLVRCPPGTFYQTGSCWECQAGSYCAGGTSAPRKCPPGTANPLPGKRTLQDCQSCPTGSLSVDSGASCRPCPIGYACDPISGHVDRCKQGQYSLEGDLQCAKCPNGFVCPDGRDWQLCPPGREPTQNQSRCMDCPAGYFSSRDTSKCLPCLPGSYCPSSAKLHQLIDVNGSLKEDQGVYNTTLCPCGTTHEDTPALRMSNVDTAACSAGYYIPMAGPQDCKPCPPGHFCADGVDAMPCPAGTYSEREGLQHQSQCHLCPAGYYCLEGTANPPGVESLCPEGFFCPIGTRSSHAYPCPTGTFNDRLGQGHRGSCKICSEGLFCQEGSFISGSPCSRGKFCPAGTSREQDCPPGTFTHHIGASRIEQCALCPAGFYCLSNTSYPIPCQSGTFNPLEGQDEPGDCIPCPAGSACTRPGLSEADTECSAGYVCPVGSRASTASDNACPAGTFSDSRNLTHKSQCDICPPRFFCATGSGGKQRPPDPCPRGHYCPPGTKLGTQYKCPPGTWSDRIRLASEAECYPCPSGWFCFAGAEIPSGKCSAGHFCPEGSQFGTQFPCPPGTFNLKLGSVRVGECSACPLGSYCPLGSSKPAMCPMGSYRAEQGARDVGECEPCPAGTFCSKIGMGSPVPCGAGNFSDHGATTCLPCSAGHYCNEDRTSRERMMQLLCPAGRMCPRGMAVFPEEDSNICPQGHYCPEGSIEANPCPNGTYGDRKGLGKMKECEPCPEGYFCYQEGQRPQGITHPTDLCAPGYHCPLGTGFPFSHPCPAGTYWIMSMPDLGVSPCFSCPEGFFCDVPALLSAKVCPAGSHCMPGSTQPVPCPEGTYSGFPGISSNEDCKPCEAGHYCAGLGLTQPSGYCHQGYYCPGRATSAAPPGSLCPPGSYCPVGSAQPTICPPGTYSNRTGLVNSSQCLSCPPGKFCNGLEGNAASGSCHAGYYCTSGSTSPIQHEVMEGFFSLEGAFRPEPCPPGTFQPLRGQSSCRECPPGTYCNQSWLTDLTVCPEGHFCPPGTISPNPCPLGTFSNVSGNPGMESCVRCPVGMYCSKAGISQPDGTCEPGYYCLQGSYTPVPVNLSFGDVCPAGYYCSEGVKEPCSPGTWSNRRGAMERNWCSLCPPGSYCDTPALTAPRGPCLPGYFCSLGSKSPRPEDGITGDICPKRHFCPEGSSEAIACFNGTYSNTTGKAMCNLCPSGHVCPDGDIILCPAGYYCMEELSGYLFPCPAGTFNPKPGLTQADGCHPCPPGMFCRESGSSAPSGPCQAGFYCTDGSPVHNPVGSGNESFGGPCPAGHFCPPGTGSPLPCPLGTFSDRSMLIAETQCAPCPPGYYCVSAGIGSPTGLCMPGYYCLLGVSSSAPAGENVTGEGGECPLSHYCPGGSAQPIPCPAGTYNNLTRQDACLSCPAGFYCPGNTSDYTVSTCPAGFYCPKGTKYASQFPCPRGYFNPDPSTQSLDSCLPCTPGHYCGSEGLNAASGKCDPGWYCISAAWTPQPFDLDNYTSANCLCPATATGGKCLPGFYCPEGSTEPLSCPAGAYCAEAGLPAPSGYCHPGFFCTGGSTSSAPEDAMFGNVCPPGTFCSEGSHHPTPCPPGTFSAHPGQGNDSDCKACPPGHYCQDHGQTGPTGLCLEGFFCPERQSSSNGLPCPRGHYCLEGSTAPSPCQAGTYQSEEKQTTCRTCEAGYYCDSAQGPVGNLSPYRCPQGYFCPLGTEFGTQYGCPAGTYGPRPGLLSIDGCSACPPGKYCQGEGLGTPTGHCSPGYWCKEGAQCDRPQDGVSGIICPPGHYCTAGTDLPAPCPRGTWSNSEGLGDVSECQPCPGGHFCNTSGEVYPSGLCTPGYFCVEGSESSSPSHGLCPPGHFCRLGSTRPSPCPPGTYTAQNRATECQTCPGGKYCTYGVDAQLCPRGFFCPQGTGSDWKPCPPGTYSSELGLDSVSGCRACEGGKYCRVFNATDVTGDCNEGYYCTAGSQRPNPEQELPGSAGPCPSGYFCPRGSVLPTPCPPGTFSSRTKLESEMDCSPCPPGHYCGFPGLVVPTGECSEGFYCSSSAISSHPFSEDHTGGPCPPGHFCPVGSAVPQPCPPGTFSSIHRQGFCQPCIEGFFCTSDTSSLVGKECPPGFYCPQGTISPEQYPCPGGTYNPHMGKHRLEDCAPCDPGLFCKDPGQKEVTGNCSAGFFCSHSMTNPTPNQGLCPRGHYCPMGSISPQPCPAGSYSNNSGNAGPESCVSCDPGHFCDRPGLALPNGECDDGFYCTRGATSPRPMEGEGVGGLCPPGHFCPRGSQVPTECPPGYMSVSEGQRQCADCPEGFYCPAGASNKTACPKGYYCPIRTDFAFEYPCPRGTFSEALGAADVGSCHLCPPGMFCSKPGAERPDGPCSPGWFCAGGSVSDRPVYPTTTEPENRTSTFFGMCPKGTFCPGGSFIPILCTPGHYCGRPGLSSESGICDAGHYCSNASSVPNPQDGITGDVCPPGTFCMRGSTSPAPCPPGTFLPHPAGQSLNDCIPCTAGWYCIQRGSTAPNAVCPEGWYCPVGTQHPQNPDHRCPVGHCCPAGSPEPKPCPLGKYQDQEGQSQCKICPASTFCGPLIPEEDPGVTIPGAVLKPTECPPGFYCVPGTEHGHQHPCPLGTFSNKKGIVGIEECSPCPGGAFCASPGLSSPSGTCSSGYYCTLKAQLPNPADNVTGGRCPSGYYCPAGSGHPLPCPGGTFQPLTGMSSKSSCLACPGGKFCKGEGRTETSGNCSAGFFCPINASIDGITGSPCPKGHHCPAGAAAPIPCENGFFQDLERSSSCKVCPAGFYCDGGGFGGVVTPGQCPAGHFCPEGSQSSRKHKCPRGTYGPGAQLASEDECTTCPASFFCASEALSEPTGHCLPGYWCIGGAKVPNPTDGVTGNVCPRGKYCKSGDLTDDCMAGYFCDILSSRPDSVLCAPGFYCPAGTESPQPCDSGTYAPFSGNTGPGDCQPCPPGHYCNGTGQTRWHGLCFPGFYCPPGQISSRPSAFRCPSGFFCPTGSGSPTPCESGSYQSQEGKESCIVCPTGFYCSASNDSSGIPMPIVCPTGHYCPPGASFITTYPCPPGTYRPKSGGSSVSDCEECPAGMYCSSEGLNKPTGHCHAGYYCSQGAVNPTPINPRVPYSVNLMAQNDICPAGHYCPSGTLIPVPCPLGTFSMSSGLSSYEECQPCPAGQYCTQAGLADLSQALPCSSGYVCKEGSSVSCPTDEIHGYQCPAGFYCPSGTTVELPCFPGTFSPMPGASACLPCPAGSSCMNMSTVEPVSCPRGNYCPALTAAPTPCPDGTFNPLQGALSSASCKKCPAGRYCRGEANWEPTGLCSAGFFCEGEASEDIPQKTAQFPLNGPCPAGYYCPEGTPSPNPCPPGTLRNSTGGVSVESCDPCYAGHFCATGGLSSPTGECAAGFYCPANFTSATPNAFLCPKGHFCPPGAFHPIPCPTGEYQPNSGSHSCIPCQPRYFCQEALAGDPQKCPPHSYCPAGALFPLPCPNGTYTPREMTGLRERGECLPCPPGKYCRGGKLQGWCAAGHYCLSGSAEYTPHGHNVSRSSLSECSWGQTCAGICPAGFYCQEGTALPRPCPANTLRTSPGARHRDDCLSCPLGLWCREGNPVPAPCPIGHYCTGKNQTNANETDGPQECPVHTYRALVGAKRLSDCQRCPPGYYCKTPGTISFEDYPCPPGFWCPGLSDPMPCPAGTQRTEPGAASIHNCEPCPAGHYCSDPAVTLEANVMGIPCRQGYECPLGSVTETICRLGSYCLPRTGIPPLCPGGYFCPEGSSTYNTSHQLCTFPYYCPPGSQQRMTCAGGSTAIHVTGLRDAADTSCQSCEAGTYRSSSRDTPEVACQPCPPGFSCPTGADSYLRHPCQVGYYCPVGTTDPVPCPPGTYGNSSLARGLDDCHPCPQGTYNHLIAQVACFPCGSSSDAPPGARSCTCRGMNRAFQESDGSCICRVGFVFYDNREQKRADGNSDQDCQPQVEDRCSGGEVRLASRRKCVSPEQYDCTPFCGPLGGELSPELGMCRCSQYVSAEELCDRFCLMTALRMSMSFGPNKEFVLQIEESQFRRSRKLEVLSVIGPDDHIWRSDQVHLVLFGSRGVFGVIVSGTQVIEAFLTGDYWSVPTPRKSRNTEHVLSPPDAASLPRIPNPILCLKAGDTVLFQLSINPADRTSSHYPVYQKDHLYNTNPDWDYGAFRRLHYLIGETQLNVSRFAHVFWDPGTYVFVDNGVQDRSLFVTVKEPNVECDSVASRVQPSSPYQLIKHGMANRQKLNLEPDWGVILGVLLLLFLLMMILLILTVVLRPSLYSPNPMKSWKPRWRSLGEPYIPPEYILTKDSLQFYEHVGCHGSGETLDIGKKEITYGSEKTSAVRILEDFNVRTLFDKLEDQNLHLTSQLGRHRNDTLSFYKAFIQRIQVLKDLLQGLDVSDCSVSEWRKISLERDVGSCSSHVAYQQSEESSAGASRDFQEHRGQGVFWNEASSLMKALKVILMKICSEQKVKKADEATQSQKPSGEMAPGKQSNHNQNTVNKSSCSNLGNGFSLETLALQPLLFMTALHREANLKRLITASPLTRTLEEIKEALKAQVDKEAGMVRKPIAVTRESVVPADMSKLLARQLIVYRFGCAVLRLLSRLCVKTPLQLLIAESIHGINPRSKREDLRAGESYYDTSNKVLYVPASCLEDAGDLVVVMVHAVAQIKAGRIPQSTDPEFLACINRAMAALAAEFFYAWNKHRTRNQSMEGKLSDGKSESLLHRPGRTAYGDLLFVHQIPEDTARSSVFYKSLGILGRQNEIETISETVKSFPKSKENTCGSDTFTHQEEALDLLNEEFLALTKQALQIKKEVLEAPCENMDWEDSNACDRWTERKDLGVLFDIKRRCTAQKIYSAERELPYLQEPDTRRDWISTDSGAANRGQGHIVSV